MAVRLAGDQGNRLAAEPRKTLGQRRLVGKGRNDAEAIFAGDVGSREDADNAGIFRRVCCKIAEGETGVPVWRADNQYAERIGRKAVAAEFFGARHLGDAVKPYRRRADRMA